MASRTQRDRQRNATRSKNRRATWETAFALVGLPYPSGDVFNAALEASLGLDAAAQARLRAEAREIAKGGLPAIEAEIGRLNAEILKQYRNPPASTLFCPEPKP